MLERQHYGVKWQAKAAPVDVHYDLRSVLLNYLGRKILTVPFRPLTTVLVIRNFSLTADIPNKERYLEKD